MTRDTFEVDVRGGSLHVERWGSGPVTVVALHGITANHLEFACLAELLAGDVTMLAPDLRGRGGSNTVVGPFGFSRHADDVVAVLDHAGVDRAMLLGHSMGGFVSLIAAHRAPERVSRLVLVDGGIPIDLGELAQLPVEEMTRGLIGPSIDRLRMTFASPEAYLDFWRAHPAFASDWSELVAEHYLYDLVGSEPHLRSGVVEQAVMEDSASQVVRDDLTRALDELAHPTLLLQAPRGFLDDPPGLYTDEWLKMWRSKVPGLRVEQLTDVNHFTCVMSRHGSEQVAAAVRRELADGERTA